MRTTVCDPTSGWDEPGAQLINNSKEGCEMAPPYHPHQGSENPEEKEVERRPELEDGRRTVGALLWT